MSRNSLSFRVALRFVHLAPQPFATQHFPRTNYFVDPTGDDDNLGTSPQTAWKTLAKLACPTFAPGDVVSLRRGGVWHEPLKIQTKGTAERVTVFNLYGTGDWPVIDGTGVTVAQHQGLVQIQNSEHIRVVGLEVRNSMRDGIVVYNWRNVRIMNCRAHHNMFCGISAYQGTNLDIDLCELHHNSLDAGNTGAYAGLRLNGAIDGATIQSNHIHNNLGGPKGWADVANGIYLGGDNYPTLRGIVITGNNIYDNGNTAQNQAGRGIHASMRGDVVIQNNHIADQSASGVFLSFPPNGEASTARVQNNLFLRNHLRAMGALGNGAVGFSFNVIYALATKLPDHAYTGLAILDKTTRWTVEHNIFFLDSSNATWRGFIVIRDDVNEHARIDRNLYYSTGENKWMLYRTEIGKAGMHDAATYPALGWDEWKKRGYDRNGIYGKSPMFITPETENFDLHPDSPAKTIVPEKEVIGINNR